MIQALLYCMKHTANVRFNYWYSYNVQLTSWAYLKAANWTNMSPVLGGILILCSIQ